MFRPEDLGPAVAPYPPPMPAPQEAASSTLPGSEEALLRLAGKQNKLRESKEEIQIREVSADDMKGDPRVWLTKVNFWHTIGKLLICIY